MAKDGTILFGPDGQPIGVALTVPTDPYNPNCKTTVKVVAKSGALMVSDGVATLDPKSAQKAIDERNARIGQIADSN